jgi:hypothetical protein
MTLDLTWCIVNWTETEPLSSSPSIQLTPKRKPTNVWHLLDKEEGYTICGIREMFTWDNADMIPNNNRVCKRCEAKAHGQGVEIVK